MDALSRMLSRVMVGVFLLGLFAKLELARKFDKHLPSCAQAGNLRVSSSTISFQVSLNSAKLELALFVCTHT
jgi:hypothetical protein